MIDLEKALIAVFFLLLIAIIGSAAYRTGQLRAKQPSCPEPIELVCTIRATHPGVDGGKVLTVVCPRGAP